MPRGSSLSLQNEGLGGHGHFHAVRFYKDADSLCRLVATFIEEGFRQDQPAVIIATPDHQAGIVQQLNAHVLDVQRLQRDGALVLLDARMTLDSFMVDGMPNAARFSDAMVPILDGARRGREHAVVRAYGEMVDVLWKEDQVVAATRLEMLWNDLARTQAFSLLCGYAMGNFYKDASVEAICSHHTHVLSADGAAALAG